MIERINFESVKQEIIEAFENLEKEDSFFTNSNGKNELLFQQMRLLGIIQIARDCNCLSTNQVIELAHLLNDLEINYICTIIFNYFNQLDRIGHEINDIITKNSIE